MSLWCLIRDVQCFLWNVGGFKNDFRSFALGLWRADLSTWRHLQQFDSMFRQGKIEKPVHPLACSCVSVWFGQSGVKLQNHGNPNYFAKPPLDNGLFTTSFRNIIRSHKPLFLPMVYTSKLRSTKIPTSEVFPLNFAHESFAGVGILSIPDAKWKLSSGYQGDGFTAL